jgi:arsenate reductase-like glutaredoxin family protein
MITIYTIKDCVKCKNVKDILKERGIKFEEKNSKDLTVEILTELSYNNMGLTLPIVEVNGKVYDGDSYMKILKENK